MERLDIYDNLPQDMRKYLSSYGWHFNKAMFEWAVSKMKDRNGRQVQRMDKDSVESQIRNAGVTIRNAEQYDCAYVFHMAMADYYGSSIKDLNTVALFVKDYLDDPDGYDGIAMTRFYADCIGKGCRINWEDML